MAGEILASHLKYLYSSLIGTAMSGVAAYPASGSYYDVSNFLRVHIIATFGVIHASDTPVLSIKCADSVSGTPDVISTSLDYTPNVTTGDALAFMWTIEVASLPTDHHFLVVTTAGTLTNGTYVHIQFLGEPKSKPPTQDALVVAGQYSWAGGQAVAA